MSHGPSLELAIFASCDQVINFRNVCMELRLFPMAKFVAETETVGVRIVIGPGCCGWWMVTCTRLDVRELESTMPFRSCTLMAMKVFFMHESDEAFVAPVFTLELFKVSPKMFEKFVWVIFERVAAHHASHRIDRVIIW